MILQISADEREAILGARKTARIKRNFLVIVLLFWAIVALLEPGITITIPKWLIVAGLASTSILTLLAPSRFILVQSEILNVAERVAADSTLPSSRDN